MAAYRLDIAYDGTEYRGWARQPGLRTVQGEIEAALERLLGVAVPLTVAGRTDAGVHALGQVASFELPEGKAPPEPLQRALNSLTPPDVAILAAAPTQQGFDARRDARSRRYRYRIDTGAVASPFERRYAHHHPYPLDRGALERAAAMIVGRHDFTAFTPTETEHVHFQREVDDAAWSDGRGEILAFEIEADAFMHNMVRILVGTMLEVGRGRRDLSDLERLLAGAPRPQAGETAPARGLFLLRIGY